MNDANYAASTLMFCGPVFTTEAKDTKPEWASIEQWKKRYGKSYSTTLRRYVQFGPDCPMAMLISTPLWMQTPSDQEGRCRHCVPSPIFARRFSQVTASQLLRQVDLSTRRRRGGPVGDFRIVLTDDRGERHTFRGEAFFAQHYVETLFSYVGPFGANGRIFVPSRPV